MTFVQADSITQFLAQLINFDPIGYGAIISREDLCINVYKCGAKKEAMNLVSLFAKFPLDDYTNSFTSMTSFPPSVAGIPDRLMVYFKGIYDLYF